jgi:hypothetical protein
MTASKAFVASLVYDPEKDHGFTFCHEREIEEFRLKIGNTFTSTDTRFFLHLGKVVHKNFKRKHPLPLKFFYVQMNSGERTELKNQLVRGLFFKQVWTTSKVTFVEEISPLAAYMPIPRLVVSMDFREYQRAHFLVRAMYAKLSSAHLAIFATNQQQSYLQLNFIRAHDYLVLKGLASNGSTAAFEKMLRIVKDGLDLDGLDTDQYPTCVQRFVPALTECLTLAMAKNQVTIVQTILDWKFTPAKCFASASFTELLDQDPQHSTLSEDMRRIFFYPTAGQANRLVDLNGHPAQF